LVGLDYVSVNYKFPGNYRSVLFADMLLAAERSEMYH